MTQSEYNNLSKGFDERANVEEEFDDFRYLFVCSKSDLLKIFRSRGRAFEEMFQIFWD